MPSGVTLVLDSRQIEMVQEEFGYWRLLTPELKPGMPYQFGLDGKPFPDIASLQQPDVHGASVALDLDDYNWQDTEWQNPDLADYIIYELHTGTFTNEGTFRAIGDKLDHLLDLGVNAIELMPVAQFPGERNWGYDGVFPFAVQHSYGGADGLQGTHRSVPPERAGCDP